MLFIRSIYLFFLAFNSLSLYAQEEHTDKTTEHKSYWGIQYENDFLGDRSDKYYTQGIELSFVKYTDIPDFIRQLGSYLTTPDSSEQDSVIYSFGQKVFTPKDIRADTLQTDDRPYAGYLYGSITYTKPTEINVKQQNVNFLELSLGIVGPAALGEEMQDTLHQLIHDSEAKGWEYQLNNELAIGVGYSHKWRNFFGLSNNRQTEFSPHTSIVTGNVYSYLAGGFMLRWGQKLKSDIGPANIRPGFFGSSYFTSQPDRSWYLFLGHELRWVGRNIFLDGNTNVDSHRVDARPVVGDLLIGLALLTNDMRFAFSHIIRSKEFERQDDISQYGSLNFSYYF